MSYFKYEAGDLSDVRPPSIELVATGDDRRRDAYEEFAHESLDAYFMGEIALSGVRTILLASDMKDVSFDSIARVLPFGESDVVDAATGLSMHSKSFSEDVQDFEISAHEIETRDGSEITDDPVFTELVTQHGFDRQAFQVEPTTDNEYGFRSHYSLGYGNTDDSYIPVVTVLGEDHPIRQIINSKISD